MNRQCFTHARLPLLLAGFSGLFGGCNSPDSLPTIQENIALTAFKDCAALENYIEDTAVQHMRNRLDPDRVDSHSRGFFVNAGVVVAEAQSADVGADSSKSSPAPAPMNYTRTNTQVDGVDEADFVKTNGKQIFVLSGNQLRILKSWPADQLALQASIKIEGQPLEMFLEEDKNRVSIISRIFTVIETKQDKFDGDGDDDNDNEAPRIPELTVPEEGVGIDCFDWGCGNTIESTKLTIIDTATASTPNILSEYFFAGRYQNSRRVDASLRLILSEDISWPEDLRWWIDGDSSFLGIDIFNESSPYGLMDKNEQIIRDQTLDQWIAKIRRKESSGSETSFPFECTQFSAANGPIDLGFTTVATIDLNSNTASRTSIVAQATEIYATTKSLYLASRHWWWWTESGQRDWTYLFKLDISDAQSSTFVSAGGVEGHLLNQFSMDEFEDHLRVATTVITSSQDGDDFFDGVPAIKNRVSVLDAKLKLVGQTKDVAEGERIYSARFIGAKGFIVTFRETDPLFTIDLKDPKNPKIIGELKVPGFSTYIHPIDDDHLLTIGVHQPEPDAMGQVQWEERSLKLSLFDVSDFAAPIEKFTAFVGSSRAFSDAVNDHKAFNYFAETGRLAIPFTDWQPRFSGAEFWTQFVSEVRVFHVDVENGFTNKGALRMNDLYTNQGNRGWNWYWDPWVRRSVMADDYVYAISTAGVRSAHIDATQSPLATVVFGPSSN